MASYHSPFKGFWTDKPDAIDQLRDMYEQGVVDREEHDCLLQFIQDGFCIIPQAIDHSLADSLIEQIRTVSTYPDHFIARRQRQAYTRPTAEVVDDKTFRLIDFHVNSATAQAAIFAPKIQRLLDIVFAEPAQAFQSLTFIHGSQQGIHQDGAYVVVSEPLLFAASWIALEDVVPGSGELMYIPGSHRFDDYLFDGRHKSWEPKRDGDDAGAVYIKSLWERIRGNEMEVQKFMPKKGDALIWAADLVHGGAKITNDHTRRSLVTHYCPVDVAPNYKSFSGNYFQRRVGERAYISSRHYDLSDHAPVTQTPVEGFAPLRKPTFMGGQKTAAPEPGDFRTGARRSMGQRLRNILGRLR